MFEMKALAFLIQVMVYNIAGNVGVDSMKFIQFIGIDNFFAVFKTLREDFSGEE